MPTLLFAAGANTMTMQKFNALAELQQLALGKPTTVSPQTIALYVLSSAEWAGKDIQKSDDLALMEKAFPTDGSRRFVVRLRWALSAFQPFVR